MHRLSTTLVIVSLLALGGAASADPLVPTGPAGFSTDRFQLPVGG